MQSLEIYFKQVTLGWEFEHLETVWITVLRTSEDDSPFRSCHLLSLVTDA